MYENSTFTGKKFFIWNPRELPWMLHNEAIADGCDMQMLVSHFILERAAHDQVRMLVWECELGRIAALLAYPVRWLARALIGDCR
eukprot:scaffold373_cov350-Pavlova_lutheri.AAC.37